MDAPSDSEVATLHKTRFLASLKLPMDTLSTSEGVTVFNKRVLALITLAIEELRDLGEGSLVTQRLLTVLNLPPDALSNSEGVALLKERVLALLLVVVGRLSNSAKVTLAPMFSSLARHATIGKSTLDSLPAEIHLLILDTLRNDGCHESLLDLRLVNKKWLGIVTPYVSIILRDLYYRHDITSTSEEHDEQIWGEFESEDYFLLDDDVEYFEWWSYVAYQASTIQRICHKLAQPNARPEWVKTLSTSVHVLPPKSSWTQPILKATAENYVRLRQTFSKVQHALPRALLQKLMIMTIKFISFDRNSDASPIADARLAAVLAACTELEKIELPNDTERFGPLSRQVLQCAAQQAQVPVQEGQAQILGKLEYLEIIDTYNGIEVADILDMLSLPKLQDLRLWRVADTMAEGSRGLPAPDDKPRTQRAVDLVLSCDTPDREASLSEQGLARILEACPKIRSLVLRFPMSERNQLIPVRLAGALEKHAPVGRLELLWLDTQRETGLAEIPGESERLLRALSAMRHLRLLALCRCDFGIAEDLVFVLPASLLELIIIGDCGEADQKSMCALARHPNLPNLNRVTLIPTETYNRTTDNCPPFWWEVSTYCITAKDLPSFQRDFIALGPLFRQPPDDIDSD